MIFAFVRMSRVTGRSAPSTSRITAAPLASRMLAAPCWNITWMNLSSVAIPGP